MYKDKEVNKNVKLFYLSMCDVKVSLIFISLTYAREAGILLHIFGKGLGAIRAKIDPTSDVDKIFSKMYSQYVLFRNKYS
jgi:hypothetical protein